jgi:regulator of replication initiation timing
MAILPLRRKRKPVLSDRQRIAALEAALENCSASIQRLQQDVETHIRRMGAMQAEIEHLRAKLGQHTV